MASFFGPPYICNDLQSKNFCETFIYLIQWKEGKSGLKKTWASYPSCPN